MLDFTKLAIIAGLRMYGRPINPRDCKYLEDNGIDLTPFPWQGGSGLVINRGGRIKQVPFSWRIKESMENMGTNPYYDDFEYVFNPETGEGYDVSGESFSMDHAVNGFIFTYDSEYGITMYLMDVDPATLDPGNNWDA